KAYWRKMHQKAVEREAKLKEEIAVLSAKLRLRERQLFERTSEKGPNHQELTDPNTDADKKPRGQQSGSKGHGRRNHAHLPAREEPQDIPEQQRCCPTCGLPLTPFPGTEDSETVEIEVKAYRRVIKRQRYKPTWQCGTRPGIVTAPPPPKLIPKGLLGISVWVTILLDKFLFVRPTYRLLLDLRTHGLALAQGTLTDGLQVLAPLFVPLYEALIDQNLQEDRWHADETRWLVFATVEGKVGYRWYLWVFRSPSTVVDTLDESRSAQVSEAHFGPLREGILSVDRYSSDKALAKRSRLILAFCWSHVRRDFLGSARDWPQQESWALEWIGEIATLDHLNHLRLAQPAPSEAWPQQDRELRAAVEHMAHKSDAQLAQKALHPACKKVLERLQNHWPGLTVFVDDPEVPMDNNEAERLARLPVVGRQNFYGSGALWRGRLAAVVFSLFQPLALWKINPRLWLTAYLQACAANGGHAPKQIEPFLPWKMTEEQCQGFSLEPSIRGSP
ncbi:MAG: IS66 family transposase, partial [Nitrospinota bacterium]